MRIGAKSKTATPSGLARAFAQVWDTEQVLSALQRALPLGS